MLTSCQQNENQKKIKEPNTETINSTKEYSVNEKNEENNVNHLFVANGGSVLYMKNGEKRSQARFDTDGDFVIELLKVAQPNGTYKDYNNFLIEDNDTISFFEDFGKIAPGWMILKGSRIKNNLQIVSFSSLKNENSNEIESIKSTCLIIFSPETKNFDDENSKEADSYFTVMDDWGYYSSELSTYFEKFSIKSKYTKKRYIELEIENKKKIIIDTKSKINDYYTSCLLYKKGTTPIIVYLIMDDNTIDEIKNYLK